jgi:hypothetical protein
MCNTLANVAYATNHRLLSGGLRDNQLYSPPSGTVSTIQVASIHRLISVTVKIHRQYPPHMSEHCVEFSSSK